MMILPNSRDTIHKAWLYRLLSAIYDNKTLASSLYFKGGTCAAMLGFLDRFSVDLDFDYTGEKEKIKMLKKELENIFSELGLEIKDQSQKVPQYFLKYQAKINLRNTIKIDITFPAPKANTYQAFKLDDIDRTIVCQTAETMFANKLVALIDRWERKKAIAGRDLYDIHYFFMQGLGYNEKVIIERRKNSDLAYFFRTLINFIDKKINETIIDQDLNFLLSPDKFKKIRKMLKKETMMFLKDEEDMLKKNYI
ncbi:nucleotidyl transferase AbiEii/AbiGii toxin family protein [Patescibacteria group bacterium]|nr:nucleotidyl transferase AbiEii/AbiGii toxin family protein [Patescibacteria group bacterium]